MKKLQDNQDIIYKFINIISRSIKYFALTKITDCYKQENKMRAVKMFFLSVNQKNIDKMDTKSK